DLQVKNGEAKTRLEETKAELDKQQSDNQSYLASLSTTIAADSAAQQKLTAEENKVNEEMEAYIRELQAKANAAYVGGEFRWPVDVSWKRISSYFGWRVLWGVNDYHRGIDIPANAWSNIYASNGGTVIKAEYHWSYGNYVIIDHGGGKSTLYAHANQLNVKVGQKVNQGDIIAKVGTTGNSSGNHLHFEVRLNGECKNPLDYVTQPK
ncbi:MAG: peptidoglycan DD-metalloendopeptidase family protein, partial [Clostridia bacterium]|nr:peptidoglycan DD-metalloendopeptidase family protein [Clostridia bacterium]